MTAPDPLRDELLRPAAEGWRPEPGDVLIGEVRSIDERRGFAERPYPVVTVRTDGGDYVAFHGFHTVAKDELAKARPRVGDRIGIAYHGLVEKGDSRYELYRVKVVPAGQNDTTRGKPDWEAIRAGAEADHVQAVEPQPELERPRCPLCGAASLTEPYPGPAGDLRRCSSCGKASPAEPADDDIPF